MLDNHVASCYFCIVTGEARHRIALRQSVHILSYIYISCLRISSALTCLDRSVDLASWIPRFSMDRTFPSLISENTLANENTGSNTGASSL